MTDPQPHEVVWSLTNAVVASRCLHVVAELGVADELGEDTTPAARIAARCGVDPDALERVMRVLADAYVLMEIIHDWPDAECAVILSAIRRAAEAGATVLVIENVLPDGEVDPRGEILDVIMLAVTGGRERTASELNHLLGTAGFREGRVIETGGPLRIVEATAI
jgi:hypothetical protein